MSDTTNTNKFVCYADTGESCFGMKIEADTDSMIDYPHDDMPTGNVLPGPSSATAGPGKPFSWGP